MLYRPYRAVGVYSGDVGGIVHFHQKRRVHLIELPIDNAIHTYKGFWFLTCFCGRISNEDIHSN